MKKIAFRRLLTCTAAGLLLGTTTEAAGLLGKIAKLAEKKPVPFELQTAPETLAKDYLKLEPLTGMKRVAFPAFQVEFDLEGNESATSVARQVGEGGGAQAPVSTRYFLKGVDDALCHKVTDQLYASVTAQFQAAGFEVVGLDAVKAAASFAKLPLKPTPFHIDKSKHDSVSTTPAGRPPSAASPGAGRPTDDEQPARSALPPNNFRLRRRNRFLSAERLVCRLRAVAPDLYERAEVVGRWVWVQFHQPPAVNLRRQLAERGFHWNRTRQVWQHPGGGRPSFGAVGNPRQRFFTYFPADAQPL